MACVSLDVEGQLSQPCRADGELQALLDVVLRNEGMFAENREFRTQQYAEREARDEQELRAAHQSYLEV